MDLLEYREEIDRIDKEIANLYVRRMEIASGIAEYKISHSLPVFDKTREDAKLKGIRAGADNETDAMGLEELFNQIMCASRKRQYAIMEAHEAIGGTQFIPVDGIIKDGIRVVYQGDRGSYSQLATNTFFGEEMKAHHVATFRDAMCALEEGTADYAVLPIENSTAGEVSEIYDLLAEFENYIAAELIIPIRHCLMALPGATEDDIKSIYSHPQSLMQSRRFLDKHPEWQQTPMLNNAYAAMKVAEDGDISQAAIASENAAREYGLNVLTEGVNHEKDNSTRFIIVTGRKIYRENAAKISIYFELPNESGSLYKALSHFIFNGLNMVKIESRPIPGRNWEYRFFLDFEGNLADTAVRNALRGIREETLRMRILGNY